MSHPRSFQHTALSVPDQEFRVVRILPKRHDSLIRCKLFHRPVGPLHYCYKALSYIWGPEKPTHTIEVDDCAFEVRENLWHFLCRAQTAFFNEAIFIDAICIDQTDVPERSKQVQLMSNIYEGAALVLSWLGEGDPVIEAAFPLAEAVAGKTVSEVEQMCRSEDRQQWLPIFMLSRLEYWDRIWITQELIKPHSITLLYGEQEMPWQSLQDFFSSIRQVGPDPIPLWYDITHRRMIRFLELRQLGHRRNMPMREHLMTWVTENCTEKRDMIFAFLGMGSDATEIEVDYAIFPADLFLKTLDLWGATGGANALILGTVVDELLYHNMGLDDTAAGTFTVKFVHVR